MKIAFRVDASLEIGTGHVMRCLTLAEALRDKGATVVFVCREHPGHLCDLISQKGFIVFRPAMGYGPTQDQDKIRDSGKSTPQLVHAHWLGTEQESDARQTMEALTAGSVWDWVIVDHYALDIHWESAMRKITKNIMVIDDLADRRHDCEIVSDQNLFEDRLNRYSGLVGPNTLQLLGPDYALLRKEFSLHRPCRIRDIPDKKQMVIGFGGVDMSNAAGRVISYVRNEFNRHMDIRVVAGMANPNFQNLAETCKGLENIKLFRHVDSIARLYAGAYIAIGGGGVSALERCALGIPSLIYSVAENQVSPSIQLSRIGAAVYMGKIEDIKRDTLVETLHRLINDTGAWLEISRRAMETVDAKGTSRIVACIMGKKE